MSENVLVTIVIATYNRPDALKTAVQSVLNQRVTSWKLYVIGDNCNAETGEVMDTFKDDRITYINLPDRFGEQSGPNSVGIGLCQTPYLAFLNHDDVWLDDHLEIALDCLKKGKSDFFLGGTAYSRFLEDTEEHFNIHVDEIITDKRGPLDFFINFPTSYEPASSWVLKSELAQKIGYWHYFTEVYRLPIEDYILRAWRAGAKFHFSPIFTVWSVVTQYSNKNKEGYYQYESKEHAEIEKLVVSKSGDEVRQLLGERLQEWESMTKERKESIKAEYSAAAGREASSKVSLKKSMFYNPATALMFRLIGLDVLVLKSQLQGRAKGHEINKLIKMRTGKIPEKPDKKAVIERVRKVYLESKS